MIYANAYCCEVLWDIIEGTPHLGGAPFNVAAHLAKMGATSYLISSVGKDELGNEALLRAEKIGVKTDFLSQHPNKATGTVDVSSSKDNRLYHS